MFDRTGAARQRRYMAKQKVAAQAKNERIVELEAAIKATRRLNRNLKRQVKNLQQKTHGTSNRAQLFMPRSLHRHIIVALHPDRAPKGQQGLWNKRAQDFAALKVEFED